MIVHNLNFVRVPLVPNKTETPLVVDSHTVLSLSVAAQRFQSIPWRRRHVSQFCGTVQLPKLPARDMLDGLKAAAWLPMVKSPSFRAAERPNHN
jgi:hypothetical protein